MDFGGNSYFLFCFGFVNALFFGTLGGNYRDAGNDDISEAIEDTLNLFFG